MANPAKGGGAKPWGYGPHPADHYGQAATIFSDDFEEEFTGGEFRGHHTTEFRGHHTKLLTLMRACYRDDDGETGSSGGAGIPSALHARGELPAGVAGTSVAGTLRVVSDG